MPPSSSRPRDPRSGVLDAFDPGTGEPLSEGDFREMWEGARSLMRAKRSGSPLVVIQPGRPEIAPLFLTALGDWSVLALQRYLPEAPVERPFHALRRVFPVEMTGAGRARIEEMAERQVKAVREVQPHGPYYLSGYCAAGVVAFEMAQQLRRLGESIGLLFLIDTPNPQHGLRRLGMRRFASHLSQQGGLRSKAGYLRGTAGRIGRSGWRRVRRTLFRGIGRSGEADRVVKGPRESMRECRDYSPPRYDGRIVLVRSSDHRPGLGIREDLGWGAVAAGGVEVHAVEGTHRDLLCSEPATEVARILWSALDAALPRRGVPSESEDGLTGRDAQQEEQNARSEKEV